MLRNAQHDSLVWLPKQRFGVGHGFTGDVESRISERSSSRYFVIPSEARNPYPGMLSAIGMLRNAQRDSPVWLPKQRFGVGHGFNRAAHPTNDAGFSP